MFEIVLNMYPVQKNDFQKLSKSPNSICFLPKQGLVHYST
jgi:hypothetical protein